MCLLSPCANTHTVTHSFEVSPPWRHPSLFHAANQELSLLVFIIAPPPLLSNLFDKKGRGGIKRLLCCCFSPLSLLLIPRVKLQRCRDNNIDSSKVLMLCVGKEGQLILFVFLSDTSIPPDTQVLNDWFGLNYATCSAIEIFCQTLRELFSCCITGQKEASIFMHVAVGAV